MPAPSPEQVERFRRDLEPLAGCASDGVGIALSGGADSLALLLLAHAALPGRVVAATVDHGLRPEGAEEAAFCARICAGLGVPHAILPADRPIAGNVQSAARALRYRLLGAWLEEHGARWLLTAHHADDQAETLLMRLMRGAGLAGLSGIRARGAIAGVAVARPLLAWRRAELAALVAGAGIDPVADPSNADERFDRARLRRRLGETAWLDPAALARSAGALGEAEEALQWSAERLAGERLRRTDGALILDPAGLPAELRRRLLLAAILIVAPGAAPRGPEIARLLGRLESGGTATLGGVKCKGGPLWRLEAAPPRGTGRAASGSRGVASSPARRDTMAERDDIKEHMEVIGADGAPVGTVDGVEEGRIKLTRKDSGQGAHEGHHHYIPLGLVAGVEDDRVRLSANADVAVTFEEEEDSSAPA